MTVELWYGEKPEQFGEQSVLIELYDYLKTRESHYILMANFYAGSSNEIDLMVLKPNAFFLAELKNYSGPIRGEREGDWQCDNHDGTSYSFRNPFKQVVKCQNQWKDWCRENTPELEQIEGIKRNISVLQLFAYIVFYPDLHPKSNIQIGLDRVQVVSFDKFRTELVIHKRKGPELSVDDLRQIPVLLKLTRWHIEPPHPDDSTSIFPKNDFQQPTVRMLIAMGHQFSALTIPIQSETLLVGRNPACALMINHPTVSRTHAIIRRHEGHWVVEDLDSDNGTFVCYNGDPQFERPVQKINALKNGSIVRFGHVSYTFVINE